MKKLPKISKSGYKKNSIDKNEESLIIPSGDITMDNVEFPVMGIDNLGNQMMMYPNNNYQFPGQSVFEIPMNHQMPDGTMMSNNKMKKGGMKNPNNPGFDALPKRVQDLIMNRMQEGGEQQPIIQQGAAVKTPAQLRTLQPAADVNKAAQTIAKQYNLEGLPNITERNTWNSYLDWVEKQGYKPGSDSALSLNVGKNRFSELSSAYNTQITDKLKQDYAKAKARANFDKNITEEQFIQARNVNPQMMINAQKVYGQQTKKDNWFGSETASTFYPKVQGIGASYKNLNDPGVQAKLKASTGKLAPVQIYDYKTNQPVPFQGVTTITGYDPSGVPQYDFGNVKPYQSNMASSVYYDPAALSSAAQSAYQPFINPTPAVQQEMGGVVNQQYKFGGNLNKFTNNYRKQFGGEQDDRMQGITTDKFLQDKNTDFVDYLANNTRQALYKNEVNNFQNNFMQKGGPFGQPEPVPDYVKDYTQQFNFPEIEQPPVNPYQFIQTQNGIDPQEEWFNNELAANQSAFDEETQNGQKNNDAIADVSMMGAQGINSFFNKLQARKQQEWADQQMAISNTSPTTYGSRGDYDVNQGNFKPDQKTPGSFKKGGTYKMDQKTISDLISQGYNIEFLD